MLTLDAPQEASEQSNPPRPAAAGFVPHPAADIDLSLEEARTQPAGILPYGPVSLFYPYWKRAAATLKTVGLDIGAETDLVFQSATKGKHRDAGGGYTALFGKWRLLPSSDGSNDGYLKFKFDYQWQMGSQPPRALAGEFDSLWSTSKGFSESAPAVNQLYWEQHLLENKLVLAAGKIDPTAYYATNLWANDKQFFMDAAFSALPGVGIPSNGLGMNARYTPESWLYLTAGFQNQQGSRRSCLAQSLIDEFEVFSAVEMGLTPVIPGLGQGNYRLTGWHADAVSAKNKPSDAGFCLSLDQALTPQIIPFGRYEYSNGDLTGIRQLLTGGIGFHGAYLSPQDVFGLGLAWGDPASGRRHPQYTAETFYRLQLSPANQLSLGYQFIVNPSAAPGHDTVGVFWARFRILF